MAKRRDKTDETEAAEDTEGSTASGKMRLDKWLFYARFFKTRGLAASVISKGRVRLNGQRQAKPGHAIGPGDVLVFPMGSQTRMIRVLAPGTRRGPASEAQTLYLDLAPPAQDMAASLLE